MPGDVSPIDDDEAPPYPRRGAALPTTDNARLASSRQGAQGTTQSRNVSGSNIPSMRRERRRQSDAATRGPTPTQQRPPPSQQARNPHIADGARWDPLTGEQNGSSRGRPSQPNPADNASQPWSASASSPQTSPSAAPPSFGDRVRRIAKKAAAARDGNTDPAAGAFTSSRPGWRGASGRSAIVDPVHDTREVAPLRIPEKSSRRNIPGIGSKPSAPSGPDASVRRGQTPPISPPPSETPLGRPPAATQTQPPSAQRYPSPPLSGNPVKADAPAVAAARDLVRDGPYGFSTQPSPNNFVAPSPELSNQVRRKPPPVHTNYQQHHHQHQESLSSIYSQQTEVQQPSPPLHFPDTARPGVVSLEQQQQYEEPYVQPPSRFSVTTYATSNTGTTRDDLDDPIDADQPPVPALPASYQYNRPPSDHSPVTSPIDQFMTSPFSTTTAAHQNHTFPTTSSRDNTNTTNAAMLLHHPALLRTQTSDRPPSRGSLSDVNKTLPPAPPEQSAGEAQDRVGMLNAQLRALGNRRININRSIQQMTELMPTDKLMNSAEVVLKRESEKKKVEALRVELADVQREEYELGLKLHRAYKRLDREAEWEPTTLWVRRVTG